MLRTRGTLVVTADGTGLRTIAMWHEGASDPWRAEGTEHLRADAVVEGRALRDWPPGVYSSGDGSPWVLRTGPFGPYPFISLP